MNTLYDFVTIPGNRKIPMGKNYQGRRDCFYRCISVQWAFYQYEEQSLQDYKPTMDTRFTYSGLDRAIAALYQPHRIIAALLAEQFADPHGVTLIAVGGPGGTGKSTFAQTLADTIGLDKAVVLGLDSYQTPRHVRAGKNLFGPHPEANEMQLIHEHLLRLRQGLPIEKPCYCPDRGQIHQVEPFSPARFVVVEGEVSTYIEFRDAIDLAIFIDSHWKTQLNTRITRDIERRGYTPEKAIATFLQSNLREFPTYGGVSKNWCDLHLHCDDDYTLIIDAVAEKHVPLMQKILPGTHPND